MKFLLQNDSIGLNVARLPMMLKVFLYHFISYVASAPNTVTNCPKMPTPIPFRKLRILLLQSSGGSPLQTFNNITYIMRWTIFDMDMHMVLANHSFKDLYILRITNLLNQFTTSLLNIPFQNLIPIFCNPNYVGRKPTHRMATNAKLFTHQVKLPICVATESLALKAHSFN
jgi:hypothetical protein